MLQSSLGSDAEGVRPYYQTLLRSLEDSIDTIFHSSSLPSTFDTQRALSELIQLIRFRVSNSKVLPALPQFDETVLQALQRIGELVWRRIFGNISRADMVIAEVDYLYADIMLVLEIGAMLPALDLACLSIFGGALCDLLDYISASTERNIKEIPPHADPLTTGTAKMKLLDTLSLIAYRLEAFCNFILELVCLQASFEIPDHSSVEGIVQCLLRRGMTVLEQSTDMVMYSTPALLGDPALLERFCLSKVNSNSDMVAETIAIIKEGSLDDVLDKACTVQDRPELRLAEQCPRRHLVIICRSFVELGVLTREILGMGCALDTEFRGVSLTGCRFSNLRDRILQSLASMCDRVTDILGLLNHAEKSAFKASGRLAEVDRSVIAAAGFVFDLLVDSQVKVPALQSIFESFCGNALAWQILHMNGYCKNQDREWSEFYLIKMLCMFNACFAVHTYTYPKEWQPLFSLFSDALKAFSELKIEHEHANKFAYILDQASALQRKFYRSPTERRVRHRSIRFPDQLQIELHHYIVFSQIGHSRNPVYKCLDVDRRRLVVIKRIVKLQSNRGANIHNEAELLLRLHHPNIVNYLDCFEESGALYLVMEYCEDQVVPGCGRSGKVSEHEARIIGRQILNGLRYLHFHHISHKDIAPGNILRDGRGFVKISDFGLARLGDVNASQKFDLHTLSGTPAYMAPECLHQSQVSSSADIWSFGCIILYLITGQHPWNLNDNRLKIIYQLATSPKGPADIDKLQCSSALKGILRKVLDRTLANRPSAVQLLADPYFAELPESII